jgi:hypothetical protein
MSHAKHASKRRNRTKAVTVLGVAGALSLAGGASRAAVGPPTDTLSVNTAVTLYEEEISDVSLSTFYVFDHENAGARRPGLQLARRRGCGGCAGCGSCGGGAGACSNGGCGGGVGACS